MSEYLFIDTSIQEEIRVAVFDNHRLLAKKTLKVGFKYSEKLLTVIDSIIKKITPPCSSASSSRQNLPLGKEERKLRAILVVEGPGRFSALRTGVSVANALAWSQDVPVIGMKGLLEGKRKDIKKFRGPSDAKALAGRRGIFQEQYWQEVEKMILNKIKKLKVKKFKQAVIPQYGQEPNITIKTKFDKT